MKIRTYSELIQIPSFEERFRYLQLNGIIGEETFGFERVLNQSFYRSQKWKSIRDYVIVRDNGCDLAMDGHEIRSKILIHHMNPLRKEDILGESDYLTNPEYLICTLLSTHNAIHYGDESQLINKPIERTKYDTCPWRKV